MSCTYRTMVFVLKTLSLYADVGIYCRHGHGQDSRKQELILESVL